MRRVFLPETGIHIVEGIPGSGKSFYLVREVARIVCEERRPVYTNLPLVWPVFRAYLVRRGRDARCANLVQELTEEHFRRFCARQAERARFMAEQKKLRKAGQRGLRGEELEAAWVARAGEDVTVQALDREGEPVGPPANWIPGGAVVVIDEVQEWFPQQTQRGQDLLVQGYTTKHRHHQHLVMVASQDRMQVAIAFRRNCSKFVVVRNKGEDKLAWGIRFRHLGLRAIGLAAYTGDQVNARSLDDVTPVMNAVFVTSLPWHQVVFKLYRSFTHRGSVSKIRRDLERSRADAGLLERVGGDHSEEVRGVRKVTYQVGRWVLRTLARWTLRAAVLGVVGYGAYAVGRGDRTGAGAVEEVASVQKEPGAWGEFVGCGEGWARIGGRRVAVRESLPNGAVVLGVSRRERVCVLGWSGSVYVWRVGEPSPRRVGAADEVARAIYRARVGSGESAPAGSGG